MMQWSTLIAGAMEKVGRPAITSIETLNKRLDDAGFTDNKGFCLKQPFGPWPKDKYLKRLGGMYILTCDSGFHAYGSAP